MSGDALLDSPDHQFANPPRARSHPPVFPVVMAGFTAFLGLYATQPLLPLLMRVFEVSHFEVSLTITAATLAVAFAAPVAGRVADGVGRKRVIVYAAFVLAAATGLAATASGLWQFIFWRFVQGLVTPGVFAVTIAYIHEEYPHWYAGRASAAYVSGTVVGGFCGRALVGLLAASWGWKPAFVVLSIANVAAAAAIAKWLPRERSAKAASVGTMARVSNAGSVRDLLGNRRLLATNIVGFCVLFSQVAAFTYVTFYLEAPPYSLGTVALGWIFIVYLFGAAVTPIAGRVVDRYGHRAGLSLGMGVGAFGAGLTLMAPLPLIVAGLALVGSGVFIAHATASSYIGVVTRANRGLAVGLYSMSYYMGGTLGGSLPSLFWERGGWLACVLLVLGVQAATLATALIAWRPTPAECLT